MREERVLAFPGSGTAAACSLALRGIVKTFGGFVALDGVDFDLRKGEIHALLGENGAGKSSLMNIVAGIYAPDSGSISVFGTPTFIPGPADARRLRIGMVHQHYKLVKPFTGIENIMLANPGSSYRRSMARIRALTDEAAAEVGFEVDLRKPVEALSIPEQQRVEILKVLVAGARIIILDEPTAVLTDEEAKRLFATMRGLAMKGHSVVLVTHKLNEALTYADRITVMRAGKVVRTVMPADVTPAELTTMIVGSHVVELPQRSTVVGKSVLKVRGMTRRSPEGIALLDGVGFDVRHGEIYGIAGVGGNGQSELVEVLTGLAASTAGNVYLDGKGDVTNEPADRLRRFGVACIPSDRQTYALAGDLGISDNYAIGGVLEGRYGSAFRVDRKAIGKAAAAAIARFEVMGVRGPRQKAALLSGGNAQKLVIAREFSAMPSLIIAHSPSRGLDMRAAAAVHEHLRAARDRGAGVILISEDLDEIMLLSDRIGVMSRGRIVAEFAAPGDRQAIGRAMVSHA
jgi:simple sugar transport system ATP-binding protein